MDHLVLFDVITDSAVLLDKTGRIINWNSGATTLFGYSKKEVIGRSINFIYDRNYPFPKLIQELHSKSSPWLEETYFIHKNGGKGICKSTLNYVQLNDTQKHGALLIHHNLTEEKQTHQTVQSKNQQLSEQLSAANHNLYHANALLVDLMSSLELTERKWRESELRFHLLAENATDIISRHTPDSAFLYISPASITSLGYHPDDLIGKPIYKLIHNDDLPKVKKAFTRRYANPSNKPLVYRIKHKEGEFRWIESNLRLILDQSARAISEIQLSSRDITDRIQDKKARSRSQQLAHVFRLSTMEEMASGMAHEISQPLAAIVNYTRGCVRHLQNDEYDRDQIIQVMTKAATQAERAGEIVHRLKNFFCKGQLVRTPCKINNVVRETVTLLKNELSNTKTKIDFDLDKAIPSIVIDKIQIQQVILNLIQNAIEAMTEYHTKDKRIQVATKQPSKSMIEITLSDTGPGFPKETINKVFMPFFTTKAHGRGMGLAICRSIIEAHGGQFTINPNTHGKSWIRFTLPYSI